MSFLAEFCSDLLASKTDYHLLEESGGVDFIRSVRSRRNFEMSPRGQLFLELFIDEVLLGWRGCQLFWIRGSWVHEISLSSSHG